MTTAPRVLIYGANGYTGRLVAAEALGRGLRPVLSGRSDQRVRELADHLGLEARPFNLTDHRAAARHLEDVDVVLHCAGPFAATYESMVRACLATVTHYLDVTGEMEVFDGVYDFDDDAHAAGIVLIPGVGFDVVPTDHLVARLVDEVPDACGADIAVISRGGFSRGTLRTAVDGVGTGNRIRRGGMVVEVPHAHRTLTLDVGREKPQRVASTPLGDVSTAHHGYGLTDLATFTVIPIPGALRVASPLVQRLVGSRPGAAFIGRVLDLVPGPGDDIRERTRSTGWAHVWNAEGDGLTHAVDVTNTYSFTARSMVHAAITLTATATTVAGALTPAAGLGRDFLLTIPRAELSWPLGEPQPLSRRP